MALLLLFLGACGNGSASPSPSSQASASPSAVACTTGGPASASWTSPDKRTTTTPPIVSATVSGDTLALTFDQGTPAFEVIPQPTAHFTARDGRGGEVDLSGAAGVLIILRGFRGDMQIYTGPKDFMPRGSTLVEVREIGDFEGVVGWAAGLTSPGCAGVTTGATSLTFHFQPGR